VAADRDEALAWFSEKLLLMLTFEGDPAEAEYLLDEWPEGLLAQAANPTIPVFVVSAHWLHTPRHHKALDVVRSELRVYFGRAPSRQISAIKCSTRPGFVGFEPCLPISP